jgi:hypothetical protein
LHDQELLLGGENLKVRPHCPPQEQRFPAAMECHILGGYMPDLEKLKLSYWALNHDKRKLVIEAALKMRNRRDLQQIVSGDQRHPGKDLEQLPSVAPSHRHRHRYRR